MTEPAAPVVSGTLDQHDLEQWGRAVGGAAVGAAGSRAGIGLPLVLALRGPLGAGKSVLARAVARGAGVESPMPSPTYNLLFTYGGLGAAQVVHMDLYRLDDPDDVWELGWQELGEGEQLVLIEWPERAESLLPRDRWDVRIEPVDGEAERRRVSVTRVGAAPEPPPLDEGRVP